MRRRSLPLALLAALAGAGALAAPAQAWVFKAKLVVTGGLTISQTHDTTATCSPGQRWTMIHSVDLDFRTKLTMTGYGSNVDGTQARMTKGARHATKLQGYEETNNCPPYEPVALEAPACRSFAITQLFARIGMDPRGGARRVVLRLERRTGPGEGTSECLDPYVMPTPSIAQLTSMYGIGAGLVLPLDLRARSVRTLGVGRKLIRVLHVGGDCDAAVVYRGRKIAPAPAPARPADGDCTVDGDFNVELTRTR